MIGSIPTLEARKESHETINKQQRYRQIIECLKERPEQSAKQIAVMMMQKGYIPTSERNFVSPRLTELGKVGIVEPIGKRVCAYTHKKVSVWTLRNREEEA